MAQKYVIADTRMFSLMPSTTQLSNRMMVLKEEEDCLVIQRIQAIAVRHIWVSDKLYWDGRKRVRSGSPDVIFTSHKLEFCTFTFEFLLKLCHWIWHPFLLTKITIRHGPLNETLSIQAMTLYEDIRESYSSQREKYPVIALEALQSEFALESSC